MEERLDDEHDELGDVLFQVYFLTRLLEEEQAGDLGSVAAEIEAKLIRRHAHIFGDDVAETAGDVRGVWERVKRDAGGPRGHVPQRAEHAAGTAAGAQGPAAGRRRRVRLGARARGLSQDRRGARRARRPAAGPAVGFGRRGRPAWPTSSSACATSSATCCLPPSTWRARRASTPRSPCARPATASCAASTARPSSPPARAASGPTLDLAAQDDYYRRAKSGEGGLYTDIQEDTP